MMATRGILDHISLGVSDLERARAFYDAALAPLGIRRLMDFPGVSGYGIDYPAFWIGTGDQAAPPSPGFHVAFGAPSRAAVNAFHAAALGAGADDNGPPGLRPQYHPTYYAAFAIDPDGHHIEAVCHAPDTAG